jgi:hypothetical protein
MLLPRRVKDCPGKLRIERARDHAFEHVSAAVPQFDAVRKLLGFGGDQSQPRGLGYARSIIAGLCALAECQCQSVLRAAPAGDDAVLVAQGNVAVRVLACRRIICRITDAGIGGDRDDLLNRGAGLVPNFDLVGQIFPIDRTGRAGARRGISSSRSPGGARRNSPLSTDVIGRFLLTFTRMADRIAKSQGVEPLTAGNVG